MNNSLVLIRKCPDDKKNEKNDDGKQFLTGNMVGEKKED